MHVLVKFCGLMVLQERYIFVSFLSPRGQQNELSWWQMVHFILNVPCAFRNLKSLD